MHDGARRYQRVVRDRLARNGIAIRTEPIDRARSTTMGAFARFGSRREIRSPRDAMFFPPASIRNRDLAITLGCALNTTRHGETGTLSDTNVPRVFVAGDASRDAQFVVVAAAEGVKAALAINKALQARGTAA